MQGYQRIPSSDLSSQKLFESQELVTQTQDPIKCHLGNRAIFTSHESDMQDGHHREFYQKYISKPSVFVADSTQQEKENSEQSIWKVSQLAELVRSSHEEIIKRLTVWEEMQHKTLQEIHESIKLVRIKLDENERFPDAFLDTFHMQTKLCSELLAGQKDMSRQLGMLNEATKKPLAIEKPVMNKLCTPQKVKETSSIAAYKSIVDSRSTQMGFPSIHNFQDQEQAVTTLNRLAGGSKQLHKPSQNVINRKFGRTVSVPKRKPALVIESFIATKRYVVQGSAEDNSSWPSDGQPGSVESSPAVSISGMFFEAGH